MAVKTGKPASVPSAPAFASNLPEEMTQGGLKDDFDGVILKARYVPWDYNGNLDHHILAVALTIQPEGEEPFTQHYSAGNLEEFVPAAEDGTPADLQNGEGEALEGVAALRVGKKEQMSNSSNWASFVGAGLEAGFPKAEVSPFVTFVEGTSAHFNRVPQKKRSGIVTNVGQDGKPKNSDILVITEYKGKQTVAQATNKGPVKPGPAKMATKTAPAQPVPQTIAPPTDLQDRVSLVIAENATEEGVAKSVITAAIMKAFQAADKAKALKLLNDKAYLEGAESFAYDPDSATFFSV